MFNMLPELTMTGIIQALTQMRPEAEQMIAAPAAPMVAPGQMGGQQQQFSPQQGQPNPPPMPGGVPPSPGAGPMVAPAPPQPGQVGPPRVDPMQMAPTSVQQEYGNAMLDYQRAMDSQSPLERFFDSGKQRSAVQNLVKAQDKMGRYSQSNEMLAAQRRADSTYGLAMAVTGDPEMAKQVATLAIQDPTISNKLAEQATKPVTPVEMEREYQFIQQIEDPVERERVMDSWLKQKETIMKMPLEFGYMYGPNGEIQYVPGEDNPKLIEARLKQAELAEKQWKAIEIQRKAQFKVDEAVRQVKRSLKLVGPGTTGLIGSLMSKIPGTDARNLQELLITQQAGIAFEALREMREASSTGGALGNVSNREIELLYNSFAALNQEMSEDELRRSLMDVMMKYEGMQFALANEQKYNKMFDAGEFSDQDMRAAINKHVNEKMRKETNVSEKDWEALTKNPELADKFTETYGWVPRLTDDDSWVGYTR